MKVPTAYTGGAGAVCVRQVGEGGVTHMNLKLPSNKLSKWNRSTSMSVRQGQQGATNIVVDGIAYLLTVVG